MNKYNILVTCPPMLKKIDAFRERFSILGMDITTPDVVQTLSESELIQLVPKHDGWIIGDDPATEAVFTSGKQGSLKAAVKWGIGVDNVDFETCAKLQIPITNTPGIFGDEVADLAVCYILGLARDAFYIDRNVRKGNWLKPSGVSLRNKTIGIVGLGDIGKSIAFRMKSFGMRILGWDPFAKSLPKYINLKPKWPDGVNECDFLVLACSLNKNTKYIFNKRLLDEIKPGLRLVNISRGQLIDEISLIEGLKSKKIISAALDVFENEPLNISHEILNFENCILGSHNGSNTEEAVTRASLQSIDLLYKMLRNQNE